MMIEDKNNYESFEDYLEKSHLTIDEVKMNCKTEFESICKRSPELIPEIKEMAKKAGIELDI